MLATYEVMAQLKVLKPRFFEGLTAPEIASVIAPAAGRKFPAHSVIAHEGYPAEHLFLMIHGRARGFCMTPAGEKIPALWFPPGEVFGAAAFLSQVSNHILSTEAVNDSTALVWDRTIIRDLSAKHPRLIENSLLMAYDYLVLYRSLHISATCQTAPQRLAQVLGNLAKGMGRRVTEGVELNVRNEELADEANITIFTASRLLNEWQRKGLLTKSRGKVVVHSPDALTRSEG